MLESGLLPKTNRPSLILIGAGAGIAAPAAAAAALRMGAGAAAVGAAAVGLAVLLTDAGPRLRPARGRGPLAAFAAAGAASTAVLLPRMGALPAALLGLTLLAAGALLWFRLRPDPEGAVPDAESLPAWAMFLAAAAAVAWTRALGLLWGNSLYAACGLLIAAPAGLAAGIWLKERRRPVLDALGIPRGIWIAAAGFAGTAGLAWVRSLGLNAGSAEHLIAPLRGPADAAALLLPSLLALAAWFIPLPLAAVSAPGPRPAAARLLALAGPGLAWLLIPKLGAPGLAAACSLALCAGGLLAAGRSLRAAPVLSKIALAAFVISALLAWNCRRLLTDVWLVRLNNAWPGGRFLAYAEDGRELLAWYVFSSGEGVLLDNGAAWHNGEIAAKREAHLPLLMHGSAQDVLLLGTRHPATITAALSHGARVTVVDPHPDSEALLRAQAAVWPPPLKADGGASLQTVRADPRRYLRGTGPDYDAIIIEQPFPAGTPEAARMTTLEAMREARGRLKPGGIAAWRLPGLDRDIAWERTRQAARRTFAHAGSFGLPGGELLICSDRPLDGDPDALLSRLGPLLKADDAALGADQPAALWQPLYPAGADAEPPDTDSRFRGALSLP